MIYQILMSKCRLLPHHEKELREKRGFSSETIKRCKFVSGGEYLLEFEKDILSHSREELISSGICLESGGKVQLSPLLLEDRILIPYLNKEGVVYYLRPHKLGLKGVPVEIYQELNAAERVILTEGEFKATAAMQLGFPAIAVPGISSFSYVHFERLVRFLNTHKVKHIVVMFDNEVKDDPRYPKRYKENPMVRYDTQFYAYYMAKSLSREGFSCKIAVLPDAWRIDGKIDIDGALAQGKTHQDFLHIQEKDPNTYLAELPKEAYSIIKRKLALKYFKSHIRKEFGKYVATRRRGKTEYEEAISNFTIKITATHDTIDGMIREVVFINEFGDKTPSFSIAPESMCGSDSFSTFCLSKGNYIWRGTKEDLYNIWESEFLQDNDRRIVEPDHLGWVPSEKMWIFGNVAFKDNKELRPDDSHIFWVGNRGLKPVPLAVTTGKMAISEGIPYLHLSDFNTVEAHEKLSDTIGRQQANLCIGWITAVLFLEDVFQLYGCFPFLFITGRRGSGKSTIAEWLMNFYGIENAGKMASDSTPVYIQRCLSYYSSLPVFIDEYRNTKQVTYKNGFLRNAYNRQSAGKGIRSQFGVREAKIRGTLLLSGEETPEDNALLTRCVVVFVSEKKRQRNHFNWFMKNRIKFSNHTLRILREYEAKRKVFLKVLDEAKNYFTEHDTDDRTAINYATVAAGYACVMGEDIDFAEWLASETKRVNKEYYSEQAVEIFLEDLLVLKTLKKIPEGLAEVDDNYIYLYFNGLYTIWAQEYRKTKGTEPFKASAIRDYLREEEGFLSPSKNIRIGGVQRRCIVFDRIYAPDTVKALADV